MAGSIDIDTGNLTIESLQDETSSNSKTEGYNAGMGVSPSSMVPSAIGANENSSNANSQWVNNQTTLIGGISGEGDVNISADKTSITGAVLASATRNEDGSLTDNTSTGTGSLNLATNELIIEDIKDKDHSENEGFNISAGLSSSGSSSVGLTSDGHKKEQTTLATIGGGNITKKDGSAHEEELVASASSDLNNSQEITKDMKTGGLNATVVVDHRLASKDGIASIQKDFITTSLHVGEIAQAVEDVATTDKDALDVFDEVNKYAVEREVLAQQAADKAQQEKLRGEKGADGSEEGLQNLSDALTEAQGLEEGVDVALFDGSQIQDDTLAIDSSSVNKTEVEGAYHENGGDVYVNIDNTDMTNSVDTVSTLVHEQARHEMAQSGETGSLSRDDQTTLATNHGDRAGEVWEAYSGLNGESTQGTGNQQDWNAANKNSANVKQGTQSIAKVNNNELKARQANRNEASMLDKARLAINNDTTKTSTEKAQQLTNLDQLACAEIQCAAGVPENDPQFEKLTKLQAEGEKLKTEQGLNIIDTLTDLGVKSTTETAVVIRGQTYAEGEKQEFQYDANGSLDSLQDLASSEADGFTSRVNSAAEGITNSAITTVIAPVVDLVDGQDNGAGFTEYMAGKTADNAVDVANYESKVGESVLNSLSAETHKEAPNYVADTALATLEVIPGAKVAKDSAGAALDKAKDVWDSGKNKTPEVSAAKIEKPTDPYDVNWKAYNEQNPGEAKSVGAATVDVGNKQVKIPVAELDVDAFKNLKKNEVVGDNLEHDHIPSSASIIRAEEKRLGRKLNPSERTDIHNNGTSVERTNISHAEGPTYRGRNTQDQIESDSNDLAAAACRDCDSFKNTELKSGKAPEVIDTAIDNIHDRNINVLNLYTKDQLNEAKGKR